MNQEILAAKVNALSTIAEARANFLQNVEQLKSKQQLLQSKAEELRNVVAAIIEAKAAKAQATQNVAAIEDSEAIAGQNSVDNVVEEIVDDKVDAAQNIVKPGQ